MRSYLSYHLSFLCIISLTLYAGTKEKALLSSLNPQSIEEHLALYELFPNSIEGQTAKKRAIELLFKSENPNTSLSVSAIKTLFEHKTECDTTTLRAIKNACSHLHNRKLKGYHAKTKEDILKLPAEEIDIAKAVFISTNTDPITRENQEAILDLMAMQILAQNPKTTEEMIDAINTLLFFELGYRFPPKSKLQGRVDEYTFLSSVMEAKKGICLGTVILYLAIAQRLGLPLEIITPPGHIFVRYRDDEKTINIETTARGIHLNDDTFKGLETKSLQKRSIKDVVGLAHVNAASKHLTQGNFKQAIQCYKKALHYLENDPHTLELLGYCYYALGDKNKAKTLLSQADDPHTLHKNSLLDDCMQERIDPHMLTIYFSDTKNTRKAMQKRCKALQKALENAPQFTAGHFALAIAWLELDREKEALQALETYLKVCQDDLAAAYYASALYLKRADYQKAWAHYQSAHAIAKKHGHKTKILKEVISEVIREDVHHLKLSSLMTITSVEISKDLHHAKVYMSVIGNEREKQNALNTLQKSAGKIGKIASKKVVLRFFPHLTFKIDDGVDKYMHIEELLNQVHGKK